MYEHFADDVVRVEVLEAHARAPSTIGTAFHAAPGVLLTNYHVVRQLRTWIGSSVVRTASRIPSNTSGAEKGPGNARPDRYGLQVPFADEPKDTPVGVNGRKMMDAVWYRHFA